MRRALLALTLVALLAGCTSPKAAPQVIETGQIDGAVVDQLLRPFDGQPVYLTQTKQRDDTSPLGGFTFRNVPVGSYTVLASRDGYRSAFLTVTVQANEISRVILQLLPIPDPSGYFVAIPHAGGASLAVAGDPCVSCSWRIPLEGQPMEITLDGLWGGSTVGNDQLQFHIKDNVGHTLFLGFGSSDGQTPFSINIQGSDLHEAATALQISVSFGPEFTTRPRFLMEQVATFYYGGTRDSLFSAS